MLRAATGDDVYSHGSINKLNNVWYNQSLHYYSENRPFQIIKSPLKEHTRWIMRFPKSSAVFVMIFVTEIE